jgi:hypothetical protein
LVLVYFWKVGKFDIIDRGQEIEIGRNNGGNEGTKEEGGMRGLQKGVE